MDAVLSPRHLPPGAGIATLSLTGTTSSNATFSDLQFSYPLKLIVPSRFFFDRIACLYMLSYGGGLVAGDHVKLELSVEMGAGLVILTQGKSMS